MKARTTRRLALAAVPAALLVAAAPASATAVKLSGGDTTLKLAPAAASALKSLGVSVAPISPAKAGAKGVTFPIVAKGSAIHPGTAAGTVSHSGGLKLTAGKTTVALKSFQVKVGKRSTLSASIGGARVTIISLDTSKAKIKRTAVTTTVSGVVAKLNATGAKALNSAFKVKAFTSGLALGRVTLNAKLAQVAITSGVTEVAINPATLATLTSAPPAGLGLTPGIVAPAKLAGTTASFPITPSVVAANLSSGTIGHTGGLSLAAGSTKVELTRYDIKLGAKPTLSSLVNGGGRATIFDLSLASAKVKISGLNVTVSNVPVTLSATGAAALNQAFNVTALAAGVPIGTATVKAKL